MTATAVRELIVEAFEEIGVARNDRTIRYRDGQMALERLNNIVRSLMGQGIGEKLTDQTITTDTTICSNTRVVVPAHTSSFTVTLPEDPEDGALFQLVDAAAGFTAYPVTVDPNGRLFEGSTSSVSAALNGYNLMWLYRGDLADWKRVAVLDLNDDFPFPIEFDDAFIIQLAIRLAPRFGKSLSNESVATSQRALSGLRARYRQRVVTSADQGVLMLSDQAYGRGLVEPLLS